MKRTNFGPDGTRLLQYSDRRKDRAFEKYKAAMARQWRKKSAVLAFWTGAWCTYAFGLAMGRLQQVVDSDGAAAPDQRA